MLNSDGTSPVNNLVDMSAASPDYAPAGQTLLAVSVIGLPASDDAELDLAIREQMRGWYGESVQSWRHLRTYRIPHALPQYRPVTNRQPPDYRAVEPGVYCCGDFRESPSINGALESGRNCAAAILNQLAGK